MSLNDKNLANEKTHQRKKQVADMETLAKIIPMVTTYVFLVENESLLNKKSTNHKKKKSKTCIENFGLTLNTSFSLILINH